jgi:hypothetical protein
MPTYLRLFPATNQFELKNGALNVAGHLYVYYNETDDLADIFDENGTQLQQPAILDNNGRARGLFVDASRVYRLEVYDQFDGLVYTVRKMVPSGGGAGSALGKTYEVVSSDGSIAVDKFDDGGVVTYDLSANVEDGSDLLEWIRCDGGVAQSGSDIVKPTYSAGTMLVGTTGVQVKANAYYHVTAHLRATKSDVYAYYDNVYVLFSLGNEPVTRQSVIIDYSMGLSQDFEVSTDVKVDADSELNLSVIGASNAGDVELLNMEMHRIYSGTPVIPGGVQRTLIAGANITIEHTGAGDVISSTGGGGGTTEYTAGTGIVVDNTEHTISVANNVVIDGSYVHTDNNFTNADASKLSGIEAGAEQNVQSDWSVTDTSSDAYIANKPDLSQYATQSDLDNYQPMLTAGQNISIDTTTWTISASGAAAQIQSDWAQTNDQSVDFIKNKPQNLVQDADYVHTDNNFTNADVSKLAGIAAGAEVNVQSDWSVTDSSSDAYIANKPQNLVQDASYVHTDNNFTTAEKTKLSGIAAGAEVNVQANWNETDSSSDAYILNKPDLTDYVTDTELQTILQGYQEALTAGNGISISSGTISAKVDGSTITVNSNGELVATGSSFTQQQSNWTQVDTTAVDYIKNKPTTKPVVAGSNITITEGLNSITIAASAAPQVQSNWAETDTSAASYIQNKPTVPTMKELVAGNNITLTEGVSDVTVACSVTVGTVTV